MAGIRWTGIVAHFQVPPSGSGERVRYPDVELSRPGKIGADPIEYTQNQPV